jgi:hypothetical protein
MLLSQSVFATENQCVLCPALHPFPRPVPSVYCPLSPVSSFALGCASRRLRFAPALRILVCWSLRSDLRYPPFDIRSPTSDLRPLISALHSIHQSRDLIQQRLNLGSGYIPDNGIVDVIIAVDNSIPETD